MVIGFSRIRYRKQRERRSRTEVCSTTSVTIEEFHGSPLQMQEDPRGVQQAGLDELVRRPRIGSSSR